MCKPNDIDLKPGNHTKILLECGVLVGQVLLSAIVVCCLAWAVVGLAYSVAKADDTVTVWTPEQATRLIQNGTIGRVEVLPEGSLLIEFSRVLPYDLKSLTNRGEITQHWVLQLRPDGSAIPWAYHLEQAV